MVLKNIIPNVKLFFKEMYSVGFPWLDIAILTLVYFFLWGEHINPYQHYQLIKYGQTAVGKISGEGGVFQYSDRPKMRDFEYTFSLPTGKIIKSSAHTFTLDKKEWKKPKYPVTTEILYLPSQPEINWIKSDLSENLGDIYYRHLVFGSQFIGWIYIIASIVLRLSILDYRREKLAKACEGKENVNSIAY